MPFFKRCLVAVFVCLMMSVNHSFASHHEGDADKKIGVLLVAFGSSEQSAQISFENIDKRVNESYPNIPVKWAYTSHVIRKKLAKQGTVLDSPEIALAKMIDEGYTHVAVQSLHTIGGAEYHDLRKVIGAFDTMGAFKKIILGYPMLATQKDMDRTVEAILATVPKERKKEDAVVLMGHGTHHPANVFYSALNFQLHLQDPNVIIGTVEGYPDLDTTLTFLKRRDIKKVYLMPFMSVAGDHAKNDMAGQESDSWQSILTSAGFEVTIVLKGTAEYEQFVNIWVDHLGEVMKHF